MRVVILREKEMFRKEKEKRKKWKKKRERRSKKREEERLGTRPGGKKENSSEKLQWRPPRLE